MLLFLYCCQVNAGSEKLADTSYKDNIVIKPCWFEPEPDWPPAQCGLLKVPEDYSKPAGRSIELPFIIFKAKQPDNNTYPLVIAGGGGPGIPLGIAADDWANTESPLWTTWYYATVNAGRDLIMIDNRGVGSSVPRLDCNEIEDAAMALLDKKLERSELIELIKASYQACKQRLMGQGIDLSQYHVINASKDLEQLRIGLGIDQLNIYGASYASRVALVYERLYPDSCRTLILDGIFPQSIKTYENEPRRNYQAIMRVLDKCEKDYRCNRRYGNTLDRRLEGYLEQLDKSPVSIVVTSSAETEAVTVKVTPQLFFDSLYLAIYDPAVIAKIPRYLHAIFNGSRHSLAKLVGEFYVDDIAAGALDEGAYASYACFDEIPFVDFEVARRELVKYPFQHYSNEQVFDHMQSMCEIWDVPAAEAEFKQTYIINTPLLIYSGELDPVTPVELARPVIENARAWWGKVWPNSAHEVMYYSECADRTAATFLSQPELNPFINECVNDASRIIFEFD